MAENFDLIFGSSASQSYSWNDSDYQNGWQTVGDTPPTREQFDALQRRADLKTQELNSRLSPLEQKAQEQGRQAGTAYTVGAAATVDGLPADWLLVCTTAGTSGTAAITLPDPLIDGATITDGTITWTLRKIATNGALGYRQPSATYAVGNIAYHATLPTGWYLECTTAGTTGSGTLTITTPTVGGTVSDGTVTWKICKNIGTDNAPLVAGFNAKQTFTSSGTFTPTVTGNYKITLQGAGGGGGGAGTASIANTGGTTHCAGASGGGGAKCVFYEKLTAGTSYSFTIGAGGTAGAVGSSSANSGRGGAGGNSTITLNTNAYIATGGKGGWGSANRGLAIEGRVFGSKNGVTVKSWAGEPSLSGGFNTSYNAANSAYSASPGLGDGGAGGFIFTDGTYYAGDAGGDGYITFEWQTTSLV